MDWGQHNETLPTKNVAAGKTLRAVTMSALNRVSSYSLHEYRKMLQLGIECVQEELRLYHSSSLEILFTEVDDTGIVQMPPDCLTYTKIGVQMGGQLYILGMNDNIILSRATKCGVNIDDISRSGLSAWAPVDGYWFVDFMGPEGIVGGLYGLGGGFTDPQYRWDEKLKRFQLNGSALLGKKVIVEYSGTGISSGTILEQEIVSPVRNYQIWNRIENDPRVPMGEKERKKEQYEEAIEKLRSFKNKFTLQEFLDARYKSFKQGVKR